MKLRFQITKGETIRFISHLDYTRTVERAIRRAKLPVAYSSGFNPRLKFAFASALAVGTTSRAEYLDVEFFEAIAPEDASQRLRTVLPEGISLLESKVLPDHSRALMAIVNLAEYVVTLPCPAGQDEAAIQEILDSFFQEPIIQYERVTAKGKREIDLKEFIAERPTVRETEGRIEMSLALWITPTGSVKPQDVLDALIHQYRLPADFEKAAIERTGLFVWQQGQKLTPLDL